MTRSWISITGGILEGKEWQPPRRRFRRRTNNEFASNCRPTFVIPKGATGFRREGMGRERFRSCNQIRVCPFCYARWVRKMWARFDYAIFRDPEAHRGDDEPESGKRTPQNREVDLVLYRRTLTVTEADLSPAATRLQKAIQAHLDNWSRLQDLSTSKSRAGVFSGGLRSIMIYPGKEADWEVQLRCLLTSPHGRFSDRDVQQNDRREDTECTAVRQLTRRQLVRETAWMLQYPPAMLTGSAAKTVLGLRADHYQSPAGRTRRQNMNSTFGVIRQVKAEMERLGLEGRQQGCCQLPITYRTCPSHSMLFART